MKKYITSFTLLIALIFSGCGDDNAYDGENGLQSAPVSGSESLQAIYSVIQSDAQEAYDTSVELVGLVESSDDSLSDFEVLRSKTQELIIAYKSVETHYVADEFNSDLSDTPEYIEMLSAGDYDRKETSLEKLDLALDANNTASIESALYQNLHKSITGLVHTIYGEQESASEMFAKMDQRRVDALGIITQNISTHLKTLRDFYSSNTQFLASEEESLTALINQLAISSNRMREWRIGDPAGLTAKYSGDPAAYRFEYYASSTSLEAIKSIVLTHQRLMQNGLYDFSVEGSAQSEADAIVAIIDDLVQTCDAFSTPVEDDASDTRLTTLYNDTNTLQQNYTALINALNFRSDIIEADGD